MMYRFLLAGFLAVSLAGSAYAMRFTNYPAIKAVTATATSTAISSSYITDFSIQSYATGSLAGTIKVQYSNDPLSPLPTHWNDVPQANSPVGGNILVTTSAYNWLQVLFLSSGGSGAVTATMQSQGAN